MNPSIDCQHCPDCDHYLRLPGAFRRREIEHLLGASDELHIKAAGAAPDGGELYTVYCRERPASRPGGAP